MNEKLENTIAICYYQDAIEFYDIFLCLINENKKNCYCTETFKIKAIINLFFSCECYLKSIYALYKNADQTLNELKCLGHNIEKIYLKSKEEAEEKSITIIGKILTTIAFEKLFKIPYLIEENLVQTIKKSLISDIPLR
jgi:hypothetical protein